MITVYQTVSRSGTLRMALHRMDSAPEIHHDRDTKPRLRFPFRVAWMSDYGGWRYSCRGIDAYMGRALTRLPLAGAEIFNGSDLRAIQWLLEGEEE